MQTPTFPTCSEGAGKTAWRRDSLRVRLTSARSIEETGLDSSIYGGFLSPHTAPSPSQEIWNKASAAKCKAENLMGKDVHSAKTPAPSGACSKCQHSSAQEGKVDPRDVASKPEKPEVKFRESLSEHGQDKSDKRRFRKGHGKGGKTETTAKKADGQVTDFGKEEKGPFSKGGMGDSANHYANDSLQEVANANLHTQNIGRAKSLHFEMGKKHSDVADATFGGTSHDLCGIKKDLQHSKSNSSLPKLDEDVPLDGGNAMKVDGGNATFMASEVDDKSASMSRVWLSDSQYIESSTRDTFSTTEDTLTLVLPKNISEEEANSPTVQPLDASFSEVSTTGSFGESPEGSVNTSAATNAVGADAAVGSFDGNMMPPAVAKLDARSRWKRATRTVTLVNHMVANMRSASPDLLEDKSVDEILQQQSSWNEDGGGVGAAAFEGVKTVARSRSKGRKGMEGLLVRQNKGFITFFQDFYVACLKMPIGHFLIGVFVAPVALGLLFTPVYLLDVHGLTFNGVVPEDATTSPLVSAKQRCLAFLNVFLYALSLSTTFGGSPVAALSPFCLLVANVNTLMAQFLFVFLSGAVFARMSQPSYPIRCSKKAIVKIDDLLPDLGVEQQEKYKVFAVRLVLTGPSPCELVDAKICLTFRIFVKLPSGSVFCSTQDLEVVRPEVSYLRYGLMVRHIIDKKSPVYGHTLDSLDEGDASFSLTVMGMERTSMQPIFHVEDYFVCDGDVIWDRDYVDFIHINEKGQRVLDHSKIDLLKPMKNASIASQAITRMQNLSRQKAHVKEAKNDDFQSNEDIKQPERGSSIRSWFTSGIQKRKLFKSKSTSFTRADW